MRLGQLGMSRAAGRRPEEELAAYDLVEDRYRDDPTLSVIVERAQQRRDQL